MADGAEIHTNEAAFSSMLTGITRGLGDLGKPLDAAGHLALEAARAGSPKRSGRLAAAHNLEPAKHNKVRVTVRTPYAAPIHWGWPKHGIRRQPWVVATFSRDEQWQTALASGVQSDVIDTEAAKT